MNRPTIADLAQALAAAILARGDVRAHPAQANLRRTLRGLMEAEERSAFEAHGFRFSLGRGPAWGYEGLPLWIVVTDIDQWRVATANRKRKARKT